MIEMRHGEWRLRCVPPHLELARTLIERVPPPREAVELLRDDYRSFVGVMEVNGVEVVVKSPRLKNRSRWIRATTLLRPGEAFDTIEKLWRARSRGAPVADPLLAMERRMGGKVVDSWMFYFYVKGRHCETSEYAALVDALRQLHDLGWVHGDPHFDNFVWDGERVRILDCRPHRALWGPIARAYDFVLLRNSRPDLDPYLVDRSGSISFRLALVYDRWIHRWRAWKKRLRFAFGKPRETGARAEPLHRE